MLFRNDNLSSKCGCIKDQGIPGIAPFYRVGFILIDNGEQMTKLTKVKSCIRLRLIILTSEYSDYFFLVMNKVTRYFHNSSYHHLFSFL